MVFLVGGLYPEKEGPIRGRCPFRMMDANMGRRERVYIPPKLDSPVGVQVRMEMDWFLYLAATCIFQTVLAQTHYYGLYAGEFQTQVHGVQGEIYIANDRNIFIRNFHYDGQGPDAFFWGDISSVPTPNGFIIPMFNGTDSILGAYNGQNIILTLPEGKTMRDVRSLAVWCRSFAVNFGSLQLRIDDLPQEKSLGPLPSLAHAVKSDDVIIKDSKTLLIKNLYYDGAGPDAFFLTGTGTKPHSKGIKIPDEDGRLEKLRGYTGKDVLLFLPGDITVFDIDWIGLYCIRFEQNFGHVMVPQHPNIPANLEDLVKFARNSAQKRQANSPMSSKIKDHKYYGKPIAEFKTNAHDVSGMVFAASDDTFYIVDFKYDGQGPDAYFWAGTTDRPSTDGFIVPDEFGTKEVLSKYTGRNIAITLPDGKKISDIKWLSVWCRKFTVDFGHIRIPENFEPPRERNLGTLSSLAHGVRSGNVIIKNPNTIYISELYYDGAGPDAFFLVGTGEQPHPEGTKVPDGNGSLQKLRGYQGEDVELTLPDGLTVFDIDWFALYCISFKENFGHIMLKVNLDIPADLKSLRSGTNKDIKFDNCEELFPGIMQVKWKIVGDDIYMQMAGKMEQNEYMSFGRSGSDDRSAMIGADVTVAYFDSESRMAKVVDYYLSSKSQCSRGNGACPDENLDGKDNSEIISWERSDGILKVNFKRPLSASDDQDMSIPVALPMSIVAAIGPLNSQKEVAFHTHYYNTEAKMIHLGRMPPQDRCTPFEFSTTTEKPKSWEPQMISGTTKFVAQIGPAGGDKGYSAITGIQSWGIAWWINGLLIPEIVVQRGTNYTFIVEGGNNPSNSASYHPLYITNNPEGGAGNFLDHIGLKDHIVYAGIKIDSGQNVMPVGTGRYCEWKHNSVDKSDESPTFEDYKKTLKLECENGQPGSFTWMPDEDTPDLVYYQCFTHRNLGWKIHVVDPDVKVVGSMSRHRMEEKQDKSSHSHKMHTFEENTSENSSLASHANSIIIIILIVAHIFLS